MLTNHFPELVFLIRLHCDTRIIAIFSQPLQIVGRYFFDVFTPVFSKWQFHFFPLFTSKTEYLTAECFRPAGLSGWCCYKPDPLLPVFSAAVRLPGLSSWVYHCYLTSLHFTRTPTGTYPNFFIFQHSGQHGTPSHCVPCVVLRIPQNGHTMPTPRFLLDFSDIIL